jgi:hypothetical protein
MVRVAAAALNRHRKCRQAAALRGTAQPPISAAMLARMLPVPIKAKAQCSVGQASRADSLNHSRLEHESEDRAPPLARVVVADRLAVASLIDRAAGGRVCPTGAFLFVFLGNGWDRALCLTLFRGCAKRAVF